MHTSGLRYTYSTDLKGPLRRFWLRGATTANCCINTVTGIMLSSGHASHASHLHTVTTSSWSWCISRRYRTTAPKWVLKSLFDYDRRRYMTFVWRHFGSWKGLPDHWSKRPGAHLPSKNSSSTSVSNYYSRGTVDVDWWLRTADETGDFGSDILVCQHVLHFGDSCAFCQSSEFFKSFQIALRILRQRQCPTIYKSSVVQYTQIARPNIKFRAKTRHQRHSTRVVLTVERYRDNEGIELKCRSVSLLSWVSTPCRTQISRNNERWTLKSFPISY